MIGEIRKILINEAINEICTTWINDADTTIGMECDWADWLVQEVPLNPLSSKYIEEALGITDEYQCTKIYVEHERYGREKLVITVIDNRLIFSTKYEILCEYCTGES